MANESPLSIERMLPSHDPNFHRNRSTLEAFASAWETAAHLSGLDARPGRLARAALERAVRELRQAEGLQRSEVSGGDTVPAVLESLIDDVVAEGKSVDSAVSEILETIAQAVMDIERQQRIEEIKPRLLRKLAWRTLQLAADELASKAEQLVAEKIKPVHDAAVKDLVKLAPKLEEIDSDEQAVKAGKAVAGVWAQASELAQQVYALQKAAGAASAIEGADVRSGLDLRIRMHGIGVSPTTHPTRRILDAIAERELAAAS